MKVILLLSIALLLFSSITHAQGDDIYFDPEFGDLNEYEGDEYVDDDFLLDEDSEFTTDEIRRIKRFYRSFYIRSVIREELRYLFEDIWWHRRYSYHRWGWRHRWHRPYYGYGHYNYHYHHHGWAHWGHHYNYHYHGYNGHYGNYGHGGFYHPYGGWYPYGKVAQVQNNNGRNVKGATKNLPGSRVKGNQVISVGKPKIENGRSKGSLDVSNVKHNSNSIKGSTGRTKTSISKGYSSTIKVGKSRSSESTVRGKPNNSYSSNAGKSNASTSRPSKYSSSSRSTKPTDTVKYSPSKNYSSSKSKSKGYDRSRTTSNRPKSYSSSRKYNSKSSSQKNQSKSKSYGSSRSSSKSPSYNRGSSKSNYSKKSSSRTSKKRG